jgi:hypothetical protein
VNVSRGRSPLSDDPFSSCRLISEQGDIEIACTPVIIDAHVAPGYPAQFSQPLRERCSSMRAEN